MGISTEYGGRTAALAMVLFLSFLSLAACTQKDYPFIADLQKDLSSYSGFSDSGFTVQVKDFRNGVLSLNMIQDGLSNSTVDRFIMRQKAITLKLKAEEFARRYENVRYVKWLESRDERLDRELWNAVNNYNHPAVETALANGADPDTKNLEGLTVLMVATMNCESSIVETLLKAGADPDMKTDYGNTPLIMAADTHVSGCNAAELTRILLAAGADTDEKNAFDRTALTMARNNERYEVEYLLKKAGAKE